MGVELDGIASRGMKVELKYLKDFLDVRFRGSRVNIEESRVVTSIFIQLVSGIGTIL